MFRRFIAAMLIVSSLASVSYGKIKDMGLFTVDLPVGWTAQKQSELSYLFRTTDNSAGIELDIVMLEDISFEEALNILVKNLHGTKPRYDYEDKVYRFVFQNNRITFNAAAAGAASDGHEEDNILVVLIWAEVGRSVVDRIINSIKFK